MLGGMTGGETGFAARLRHLPSLGRTVLALVFGIVLLAALWFGIQVAWLDYLAPSSVSASVAGVGDAIRPETPLRVEAVGPGVDLASVRLARAETGQADRERATPVEAHPDGAGAWLITAPDGSSPLRADGEYRLVVQAATWHPALPLPRQELAQREYAFSTAAGPRLASPGETFHPRWNEPVALRWSTPMRDLSVATTPAADVRAWVDRADPRTTWVLVQPSAADLPRGGEYEAVVRPAHAADGLEMTKAASFRVTLPSQPRLTPPSGGPVVLRHAESFTITASTDLASARVEASNGEALESSVHGRTIEVRLPDYRQGDSFDVRVVEAASVMGAPLAEPLAVQVRTPAPLEVARVEPEDGATQVAPSSRPAFTFAGPVADRSAVEQALTVEPAVEGAWVWTAANRVEFQPVGRLPVHTDLRLVMRGGPDGPRSRDGGYLDGDVATAFSTAHFKRIDVSISKQVMTLLEDDRPIRTVLVATGVPGADTPLGSFEVEYKMPKARFQGTNPNGSKYDIPDVNWVLAFYGDYTIHGAYWRSQFGHPGSNGCVSMSDADAKGVFDWADEGTAITIHM